MPNRRSFLLLTAALLPTAGWPARPAHAQAATQQANDFIKGVGEQLVAVVNGPEPDQQKRVKLTQVIDAAVDVDGVARFCLGRFWRAASSQQQQNYTALFHQVLVNNITSKLGEYRGVTFTMGRAQMRDDNAVVSTKLSIAPTIHRPTSTGS